MRPGCGPSAADVKRVERSLLLRLVGANLLGALAVFVYAEVALASPPRRGDLSPLVDIAAFIVLFGLAIVLASAWIGRVYRRSCGWFHEGRQPTPEERAAALDTPWRLALIPFSGWVLNAAFYATVDLTLRHDSVLQLVRLVDTILLGGLTTCTVGYLLVERVMRPIFAIALDGEPPDRPRSLGVRPRLLLTWAAGSGVPLAGLALSPFTHGHGSRFGLGVSVVILALIGLAAGLLATTIAAQSVAGPLEELRGAMRRVEAGDLSAGVPLDDGGEIGMLQGGFNRMVAGLREREQLRELFGRHVGDEVAVHALAAGSGLGGEQREASMLFVDLVGSTALAEVLAPEAVVETLNAFFGAVVEAVTTEGGWVNKFEGDGALCVFGAPGTQPDHAARALRAACRINAAVVALAASHPGLDAAVGVSSGPVVAGNVGTETRYEYTVIGRPVNEAARLSDLAKSRPGRVLASSAAVERAGEEAPRWAGLGTVALRGQSAPTAIYEPAVRAPTPAP